MNLSFFLIVPVFTGGRETIMAVAKCQNGNTPHLVGNLRNLMRNSWGRGFKAMRKEFAEGVPE